MSIKLSTNIVKFMALGQGFRTKAGPMRPYGENVNV